MSTLRDPFPASKIQHIQQAGLSLDYVGHADITERLLDNDPAWTWEPVAFDAHGLPAFDTDGGLWIRLTVNGVTRYGYGEPQGRNAFDARKGAIGNALRNAAMRFGVALQLWQKDQPAEDASPADVAKSIAAKARRENQAIRDGGMGKPASEKQKDAVLKICLKAGLATEDARGAALSQLLGRVVNDSYEDIHFGDVDAIFKAGPEGLKDAYRVTQGETVITRMAPAVEDDPWAGEVLQ